MYAVDDNALPGQDSRHLPDSSNFTLLQCEGIHRDLIFDSDQVHINELIVYKGVIIGVECCLHAEQWLNCLSSSTMSKGALQ